MLKSQQKNNISVLQQDNQAMARPSFTLDDDIDEWVESRLVPSQSKSAWYRYATKTTMQADAILDELYEPYQYDERQEFVEAAVREKVDRLLEEHNEEPKDAGR